MSDVAMSPGGGPPQASFFSLDVAFARARARAGIWSVIVFRQRASAEALMVAILVALDRLPAKLGARAVGFTSGDQFGAIVSTETQRVDPNWVRLLADELERDRPQSHAEPQMGIGGVVGPHDPRDALRDASEAIRIGRALRLPRVCVFYEDVIAFALLEREAQTRNVLASVLSPIKTRPRNPDELLKTLEVFLDEGMSITRTATRLLVHRHTVDNRINLIEAVLGRSLAHRSDRLLIELALHAARIDAEVRPT